MALRSATPFHNQWPTVSAATDLPNVSGAPTQTADVQVGDICYDAGTGVYYYCADATLGAAVWTAFGGGAPPPGPDHQFPAIIVGNAAAGDTISVCDILDTGDGTNLQIALTNAGTMSTDSFARDVYARPGVYGPNTLTIPDGVRLLGAGRGRTILTTFNGATAVNMSGDGAELVDVTVYMNAPSITGVGSGTGVVAVDLPGATNTNTPFALRRVNVEILDFDPQSVTTPCTSCVSVTSGVTTGFVRSGHKIHDVRVAYVGAGYNTGITTPGGAFLGLRAFGIQEADLTAAYDIDVRNFSARDTECGFYTDAVTLHLDACSYDGVRLETFPDGANIYNTGFFLQASACNSTLDACTSVHSLATARGYEVFGFDNTASPTPSSIAFNSCSALRRSIVLPDPTSIGFLLETTDGTVDLQGVRLYACSANAFECGFFLSAGVTNTTGIGCLSISNNTALSDSGSANDFGHLQTF